MFNIWINTNTDMFGVRGEAVPHPTSEESQDLSVPDDHCWDCDTQVKNH